MTRFSIVVPVFNAEGFVDDCLDSACGQTFEDIEVICVNDGSTDGTGAILRARALADGRIQVVDKANGGPASARNDGIRLAKGDYILFLDADDMLEPFACERLAAVLERDPSDALVFGWSYFPAGKADRFVRERVEVRDAYYPKFAPDLLFKEMTNPYLRLAVNREALVASGVLFDESLRVGEDGQFLFALYPRIGSVRVISDKLYRYQLPHEGSIMADYKYDVPHLALCDLNSAISIFANWKQGGFTEQYGSELMKWFVHAQLYTILRQPPEVREPLTALVRQMWRASFSNKELVSLDVNEQTARLVRIVLAASDEGVLAHDERTLSKALWDWRIAEYGVGDIVVTAAERAVSFLLENKRMLMMSKPGGAEANAGAVFPTAQPQAAGQNDPEIQLVCAPCDDGEDDADDFTLRENPLVSVIVPVYNVEKFLDQALSSIEGQTLRNIEILCVNDGSTDGSGDILRKHAESDGRIRVIDKPNGGYGSACNRGLAEARGAWVAIMEPDDWIDERMYASMVGYAATFDCPVDIVKTPYWRIWMPDTPQQRRVNCSYRGRIKPATEPFKLTDPGVTHLIIHHPSIWSALYSRQFVERCNIRFMEIPGAGWADNPFLAETMCQAEAIVYLDEPFYHYREETPAKTAAVAQSGWQISLDRWHDMMDVYERLGVTDENIRRAHVRRGFTYVGLILEHHDLADEEDVREQVKKVFARMDDALVFSEDNISPGSKKLYAELKGLDAPDVNAFPYALQVVKGGLYNIVNTGPAMTMDTLKSFVGSHAKREGN